MNLITLKVPIMGEAGVGKTSLANYLCGGGFRENYESTIGVDIFVRVLYRGKNAFRLQLWDMAGQKKFSFLRKIFYKGSHVGIFVFDLTRRETFEALKQWIEDFISLMPGTPFIIVGNKADLKDKRQVSFEEAVQLARKHGVPYIETSAKTGENVLKIFESAVALVQRKVSVISL